MPVVNYSKFSLDYFFQQDNTWISNLTINHYPLSMIVWNLLLLLLPFGLLAVIKYHVKITRLRQTGQRWVLALLIFGWLLFLPNAAYVITDVRHLVTPCQSSAMHRVCADSAWLIMFYFIYALLGWLGFFYLTRSMAEFLQKLFKKTWLEIIYLIIIIPLTALGTLLGLLNRFNSWEFFFSPSYLAQVIWLYFSQPIYLLNWLTFSMFLFILYWIGERLLKTAKQLKQVHIKQVHRVHKVKSL